MVKAGQNEPALPAAFEFASVTKRFGAVVANENVSFAVAANSIHGVVGENGAGKSTILKALYGMHVPDSGEIRVRGRAEHIAHPFDAIRLGIGMVHQHFMLIPTLCVWQNIILGAEPGLYIDRERALADLSRLQKEYGFTLRLDEIVEELPVGQQQQVEILKLLYRKADILILDEPTAVLTPQEVDTLLERLTGLWEKGKTIVLITHKMHEVLRFTQAITVMRAGRVVATRATKGLTEGELAELIVGRKVEALPAKRTPVRPETMLEVRALSSVAKGDTPGMLSDLNFRIHAGEIVGFAGISGNGQEALVEILANVERRYEGEVLFEGRPLRDRSTYASHQEGLSVIPSDRLHEAVVPSFTVEENLFLGHHNEDAVTHLPPLGILDSGAIRQSAEKRLKEFDVRPGDPAQTFKHLSGGNQQKAVIARETSLPAKLLVAAFPTRGVDIGAIDFIHRHFLELRAAGTAIALFSSELEEILSLSDRIYVLFQGRIVREFPRGGASDRDLGLAMTGGGIA